MSHKGFRYTYKLEGTALQELMKSVGHMSGTAGAKSAIYRTTGPPLTLFLSGRMMGFRFTLAWNIQQTSNEYSRKHTLCEVVCAYDGNHMWVIGYDIFETALIVEHDNLIESAWAKSIGLVQSPGLLSR